MTPTEEWRPVLGWPEYEASSLGRVRSLDRLVERSDGATQPRRGKLLAVSVNRGGYPTVTLCRTGKRWTVGVHRLVAEAFLGPRPAGMEICHANDIKTDNRPENLRYDTRSENLRDQTRNGLHHLGSRTHCNHGHEFTPENTATNPDGSRRCRACRRVGARRRREAAA